MPDDLHLATARELHGIHAVPSANVIVAVDKTPMIQTTIEIEIDYH